MVECNFCDKEFDNKTDLHLHWGEEHEDELNSHQKEKVKKAKRKRSEQKEQKNAERKKMAGMGLAGVGALVLIAVLGSQVLGNSNGGAQTASFNLDQQPMLGSSNASVTVVEFGDYKCPYCKRFDEQVYPQLKENYIDTGKVKFYFINFPFIASDSTTAAVAGECVLEQDNEQFWNFHHAVYNNQGSESENWATQDRLMEIARDSTENLDYDELKSCIANRETIDEVNSDKSITRQNQVTSTPTIFVNGQEVNSGYSSVRAAIEQQLR